MIYYPLPLQEQQAFRSIARPSGSLDVAAQLCRRVLSLPMHTELTEAQQEEVARHIVDFSE
jgi:dTDP-4-amino-4,6-dideoxygalactose transaminase